MDINITLFGEMITFAVLVWVMMKYVWPPIIKVLNERQQKIAEGLQAADRAKHDLELAHQHVSAQLNEAKTQSYVILEQANHQANTLIEDGRLKAQQEGEKLLANAKNNIEQEIIKAKEKLGKQTAEIAIKVAEKIIQQNINATSHQQLVDQLIEEI
jgi:F-type H+-transporting ATPase subunit b